MCGIQVFRSVIVRFSARLAEGQNRLEQIAIEKNLHCAVLQLSKASCDGETKSASLCVAGAVSADETFGQLFSGDGQLHLGNVSDRNLRFGCAVGHGNIDARGWHGIFADVGIKVIKNTKRLLRVKPQNYFFFRQLKFERQILFLHAVFIFQIALPKQVADIDIVVMQGNVIGSCLADFEQIFDQYL